MSADLPFLTTQQVAKRLGYTLQHVRLLIRQGRLRGVKLGRDWVIQPEVLKKFRVSGRQENNN
jgi:excisionase family DNA binding protein